MQSEILREVVSSVAGEKAKSIVEVLFEKKNVNEFLIAKKLKLTINQTRNILYKLADEGLVSFLRKKDSKKGGWYTYFWTLNLDKGLMKFKENLSKSLKNLQQQANSKKMERFYYSPNCGLEFTEEAALANDYTCPECGEILQPKDNSKEVVVFEKEILKVEGLLKKVDEEIRIISEKNVKIKVRRLKSEEIKKKKERDTKRKRRAMEMKKNRAASTHKKKKGKNPKKKDKKRKK